MSARELLNETGPLAEHFAGYEARPGQLVFSQAVEQTLRDDGILLCEAGTGTGKTLAYLVPALLSGRKIIVSTATRALQEQIATRDVPLIRSALGLDAPVAVMKGLSNYLCLRRFEEARVLAEAGPGGAKRALGLVESWRRETESGDIRELEELPEADAMWREVTSSSDTRIGATCSYFRDCFVTRMKREAEAARVVIVNHHLFFADLALRGAHPGRVLPDYEAVIFDEAHQLENIATDFFGVRVSSQRLLSLARDASRPLTLACAADFATDRVRRASDAFWVALRRSASAEDRVTLDRETFTGEVAERWHELDDALDALSLDLEKAQAGLVDKPKGATRGLSDALLVAARRATDLRQALASLVQDQAGHITFLETSGRGTALISSPVDLAPVFRSRVFESAPCVIMTSATLATGAVDKPDGDFSYVRRRLGLGPELAVTELTVASPFDLPRQALLYTPTDLPSPRTAGFLDAAAARIVELIEICDGGAFVLTTSLRSMKDLASRLRSALPTREVLLQGEAPRTALLERFRRGGGGVLVATLGFWEGVDVPGSALRLVILEKVPFSVPTDPVLQARARALEEEGGNPFMDLVVPQAAILLKQGFGRLIRGKSDVGVVALLDERVHRHGYGKRLLRALPPASRTDSLEQVRRFVLETGLQSAVTSSIGHGASLQTPTR